VSEAHLVQARQLREAISSLVRAVMSASPVSGQPLAIVNEHAVRPDLPPRLGVEDITGRRARHEKTHRRFSPASLKPAATSSTPLA
jgi:hypothetical protein